MLLAPWVLDYWAHPGSNEVRFCCSWSWHTEGKHLAAWSMVQAYDARRFPASHYISWLASDAAVCSGSSDGPRLVSNDTQRNAP